MKPKNKPDDMTTILVNKAVADMLFNLKCSMKLRSYNDVIETLISKNEAKKRKRK